MTKLELLPEQQEGVKFILDTLSKHQGCYLADRMGYGKTAQAIEILKQALRKGPVLIISPSYICYNWLVELETWGVKNSICRVESIKQDLNNSSDIYLVSYNMAVSKDIFKQLFKMEFSLIICDEAHYLKTWNSNRSKLILGTYKNKKTNLLKRTNKILCLSGTPILNRVEELYNVIVRIAPKAIKKTKDEFIIYFSKYVQFTPWGIKARGVKNEQELKELIKPVFLGRQKIRGLKGRVDKKIILEVKGKELQDYIKEENEFLEEHEIYNPEDIVKITKLEAATISDIRQKVALIKIPKLMQALPDIIEYNKKPIIYVYHRMVQNELVKQVKKKYPTKNVQVINGNVSMDKRMKIIKDYDIIIATIGALREGINLVESNVVLFLELDWTPSNLEQCIARLWRKGQEDIVKVYYFLFNGGIDKYMMKMLNDKSDIINKIIGE